MNKHKVFFEGVWYESKKELFEVYEVSYTNAMDKISKLEYSLEECIYGRKLKRYDVDGKEFYTLKELSEYTGLSVGVLAKYNQKKLGIQTHINLIRKKQNERKRG